MAISKTSTYAAAVTTLKGLIDHDKTAEGAKPAAESLSEAIGALSRLLSVALHRSAKTSVTPTATTLATFRTGVFAAAKGSAAVVNDLFALAAAADLTGTPLAAAKGAAIAKGDVYRWTNVGAATEAIEYVGNLYAAGFGVNVAFN
jgi:hypothetical protein